MRDDHFLTTEDLRAANEELQSLNEEYRSTTEELETSKEELQSINEELQTVNNELKLKLDEVSRAQSDLENFVAAADVAMLFLDTDLRIKRFTPTLAQIFNIRTRDRDRPIGDLTHALDYNGFAADARAVLLDPAHARIEREARTLAGRVFIISFRPYRSAERQDVEGIVVTCVDVTAIKAVESTLREQDQHREEFLATLGHELRNPMAAMQSAVTLVAPGDDRSRRALAVLERQIRHMTRLVNDLLDATRVKHGRLRLERMPLELGECAHAAIETQRALADSRGLRLEEAHIPARRRLPRPVHAVDERRRVGTAAEGTHSPRRADAGGDDGLWRGARLTAARRVRPPSAQAGRGRRRGPVAQPRSRANWPFSRLTSAR